MRFVDWPPEGAAAAAAGGDLSLGLKNDGWSTLSHCSGSKSHQIFIGSDWQGILTTVHQSDDGGVQTMLWVTIRYLKNRVELQIAVTHCDIEKDWDQNMLEQASST